MTLERQHISPLDGQSSTLVNMLTVSLDGYIRISMAELQSVNLIHLISGLDDCGPPVQGSGAISMAITGYTEWVSESSPAISIGWDWQMIAVNEQVRLHRTSEPRSNIMLQDVKREDIGQDNTAAQLEMFVDTLSWQVDAQGYIGSRYA